MQRLIRFIFILNLIAGTVSAQSVFKLKDDNGGIRPKLQLGEKTIISAPDEGLWSVATAWENKWPAQWHHASPVSMEQSGDWQIVKGEIVLPQGVMKVRDAYRNEKGLVHCIRRFEWTGKSDIDSLTLSVRWNVTGKGLQAFLPGIVYYGNPSGTKNTPNCVASYSGKAGEKAIFEDHRYPMPFACLESSVADKFGAVIHTVPSPLRDAKLFDHWWSMGVEAFDDHAELVLYSGPITYNNHPSIAKAIQCGNLAYDNTYIKMSPDQVIEKSFYLDLYTINTQGTAFQKPVYDAIEMYKPFYTEDLPSYKEILDSKFILAKSRWVEGNGYAGFNMYDRPSNPEIVMGWCGQAGSPGFSLQNLKSRFGNDASIDKMVQQSLDFLSTYPVSGEGFPVVYNVNSKKYANPDPVSNGQGMYNIAKAIEAARKNKRYDTTKWEEFLKKTCDVASSRILQSDWSPRSTAEGFYMAPLAIASKLFNNETYRKAAVKAADYYAKRHLLMVEPYWGGTLDASGEDKEGAWAAFQGFLNVYDLTKDPKYLAYAQHACDVCLSYVVVWDIPLTPGRMADYRFKTRGWTVVSAQNQHIDIYGVLFAPEVYRMGELTKNENLKRLAKTMFLTCGQLTDPYGSQGEQMQHTNFAQRGDMSNVFLLRGGYSEHWTVFWITAHFLNAAARFEEMGVVL
ncbi:MAG: hypothetical protein PHS25_07645 [Proteiniphilum sp.]|jgi:hypothetical protein|nr:hypothetical protein [Proteiniphilum sp.]MDD2938149.1 hypothetical protein [Proteiniphilum sp.]MDD3077180.1 hypothetical protein [Proteiniphilum sp.]MDD4453074.1 hypothetical protein [Proteiniphilum sp.]